MMDVKNMRRAATALAVALPLSAVFAAKYLGLGPVQVDAATPAPTSADVPQTMGAIVQSGPEVEAAKQYALSLRDQPPRNNPFYYRAVPDEPERADPSDLVEGEEGEEPPPQINLKLTALIKGRHPRAIINGEVKQIGDEVDPGWTLIGINPDAGTATLRGPDEQTILLRGTWHR